MKIVRTEIDIYSSDIDIYYTCSECLVGEFGGDHALPNFCPNCGRKLASIGPRKIRNALQAATALAFAAVYYGLMKKPLPTAEVRGKDAETHYICKGGIGQ